MRVRRTLPPDDFLPDASEAAKRKRDTARRRRQKVGTRQHFDKIARAAHERLSIWKVNPSAWVGATPDQLLGLFVIFHVHVYGVEPSDLLDSKVLLGARSCVGALLRNEFMGNADFLAEFIRWTWEIEKSTEARFCDRGEVRLFRMGWRVQFQSRSLLTNFRVAMARKIAIGAR